MIMPPSGVEGLMDEESVIEAQIQLELDNINLDDDPGNDDEDALVDLDNVEDGDVVNFKQILNLFTVFSFSYGLPKKLMKKSDILVKVCSFGVFKLQRHKIG